MTTAARLSPKVLIMAGGTGGHVFPALTIAQELLARGSQVEWLGTRAGIEARVLADTAIRLHFISVAGLRGKSLLRKVLAPFSVLWAVIQAMKLIHRVNPACVLGMGGYVSGPGGVAARLLGKTLLIHEQNAVAGMANAWLFPLAQVAMEGFPGAFVRKLGNSWLMRDPLAARKKILPVGNPVRADLLAVPAPEHRLAERQGKVCLLVIGGSLGASVFNEVVPSALAGMSSEQRPRVWHQCGRDKLQATLQAYHSAGLKPDEQLQVKEFIDNMAEAYAWADIVLCRAGASTLAEITAIGLPAILVPYPFAADDHQAANASVLAAAGAASVLPQGKFNADTLRQLLMEVVVDRGQLLQQAQAARRAGKRDAGTAVASLCLEACHG